MLAPSKRPFDSFNRTIIYGLGAFFVFLVGISFFAQSTPSVLSQHSDDTPRPDAPSSTFSSIFKGHGSLSAEQYLNYVTQPLIKVGGNEYNNYGAMRWKLPKGDANTTTELLGDQLCIMDLDNRNWNKTGQIWANETMSWKDPAKVHGLSLGVLNHWLYAKIHGYKYYYIDIEEYADRRASWKKPVIISKILQKHKTCIYLDSDAIFNHLNLPFEWLMDYWSINPDTNSLALAFDPNEEHNKDRFGQVYLNTGFIIAQNNKKTYEIMDAWRECPEEGGTHPNCTEFRTNYAGGPTDQGGFGTYIRYDYEDDIKGLKCSEANGFTQSGTECTGNFIQHLWTGKDSWIKLVIGQQMPGDLLELFHANFMKDKEHFWATERALLSIDE